MAYKIIPTYSSDTGIKTFTEFESKKDWINFLDSKWKLPGSYNLYNTSFWVRTREVFNKTKSYCKFTKNSMDYNKFWDEEKSKVRTGIIVDDFYISGEYYFYLNFCPIYNKIEDKLVFAEVWDSDYHYFLYSERAYAQGKHILVNKKRQWGHSYKEDAKIMRRIYFIAQNKVKMICPDDLKLDEEWEYIERYRQFLNENTAWYRNFDPDKKFNWQQRVIVKEGNKKVYKGRNTILKAINTKTSPSRGVGGACLSPDTLIIKEGNIIDRIDTVNVGDFVIGADGKSKRVTHTFQGKKNMYKITQSKGVSYNVTEDHLLYLKDINKDVCITIKTTDYIDYIDNNSPYAKYLKGINIENQLSDLSVEYIGEQDYYGFECEDNLFLLSDGTITHNCNYVFFVESGVNPTLDKSISYITPNIKIGGVITGTLSVGGSVGELKECEPLRKLTYSPEENGFLGVPDLDNPNKIVSLFIPQYWNYTHVEYDDYTKPENQRIVVGTIKCYDADGNSDIARAKLLCEETAKKISAAGSEALKLHLSQNPITIDDLYAARETNPFNTVIINKQVQWLDSNYKPTTVSLEEEDGKIVHKIINKDIVTDFPVKATSYKEGSIVIVEPPLQNAPMGLYIAGVDTIESKKTITSDSLMSIHIYKLDNEINGEFSGRELVAFYTGRYEDFNISFENCFKLIKYYNARAVIENNKTDFIEYLVKKKHQHYIIKRSELPILKEITPDSKISEEYGVRMTEQVKNWVINAINAYCEEEIGKEFLPDGTTIPIYGVKRIKDIMFLKELLNYNDKINTDRVISFGLALLAGKVYETRNLVVRLNELPKQQIPVEISVSSAFINRYNKNLTNSNNSLKLSNTFKRWKNS